VNTMKATDQIFTLTMMHSLLIAGCADGNMLVYDTLKSDCLYGYGV